MLVSLLLSCLFFGLISMILPSDHRNEWLFLLLISVLILSVCNHVTAEGVLPDFSEESFTASESSSSRSPESAALHSAVSSQVVSLTGNAPLSVESDLQRKGEEYQLSWIRVKIRDGNEKEVQNALQEAFSFEGFFVSKVDDGGSGKDINLFSEEQMADFD